MKRRIVPVPDEHAVGRCPARDRVERGTIHGKVAVALYDDGRQPPREELRQVVVLDQERATGAQDAPCLPQHEPIVVVVEVAERGEPVDHAVETRVLVRSRAHVTLGVRDLDPGRSSVASRMFQEERCGVEPRDARATRGEPIGDATVAAREVEHLYPGFERKQTPDRVGVGVAQLAQPRLVEVEVVLVEDLADLEPRPRHEASL